MGQYWLTVNLDKHEYLDPHTLGSGLKLWEQVANNPGTGTALVILLAAEREMRGGGDLALPDDGTEYADVAAQVIGRWAGDRIALVGDYAEDSDLAPEFEAGSLYAKLGSEGAEYVDISPIVARVIEHELGGRYSGSGWRKFTDGGAA